ncbi:MAG: lipoyl(octanoyl) transferase LipB [Actinomycetales bacterium]|nr:lipoyl(octanoyl) transferase LipB [Actinomycetales bacterium]
MPVAASDIAVIQSGLMEYEKSWQMQRDIHLEVAEGSRANTLILIEHPSVYTAGRRTDILERPQDGTPVIDVDRGGRITWHGPGQIVGYPIVRLEKRNEVVGFVRNLEEALIATLAEFGINGISIAGKTGVWIKDVKGERKISAIGVRVAKGVTMHGFALNVCPDLNKFNAIIPCGMPEAETTSMEKELNRTISIAEVTPVLEKKMVLALARVSKLAP